MQEIRSAIEDYELDPELGIEKLIKITNNRYEPKLLKLLIQWCLEQNHTEDAVNYMKTLALEGDCEVILSLADYYLSNEQVDEALNYWEMASQFGDPIAIIKLARYYQLNVEFEFEERTIELSEKAAALGCVSSIKFISARQEGVKKLQGYLNAGENGDADSFLIAAKMLLFGLEVPQDIERALGLLLKAARLNFQPSLTQVGNLYQYGMDLVVPDEEKAFELYYEAGMEGQPDALRPLADCYYEGAGCEKDWGNAIIFYERAASAGDVDSYLRLAACLKQSDVSKSKKMLKKYLNLKFSSASHDITDEIIDSCFEYLQ